MSDVRLFLDAGLVEPLAAADPIPPALERLIERRLILDEEEPRRSPRPAVRR